MNREYQVWYYSSQGKPHLIDTFPNEDLADKYIKVSRKHRPNVELFKQYREVGEWVRVDDVYEPPVRLCCWERHYGPVCPDGKVMCCLCFNRFEIRHLNRNDDGDLEDVCVECAVAERFGKEDDV